MARRTRTQRAGKGGNTYKATIHSRAKAKYPQAKEELFSGEVMNLVTDPSKSGILAEIELDNKLKFYTIAAEGIYVGQKIQLGKKSELNIGNVIPLMDLPEGAPVFNIEKTPGDGGKFIRSSGAYALIITKDNKNVYLKMPSGKNKAFNPECRATIGLSACGGRTGKPLVKAGNAFFAKKAKGHKWPTVRGVAMNAIDHPFGGSQHHAGKSKSTARNAPPGRKVGAIASKRTGRRKKN
ncbi:MAG: 50S ribosomal protein L2 [Candidatus Diapherotrites archaeon]|nr:50S ribosomal protein L2 [Candidatus Diapherotrites archaeon]